MSTPHTIIPATDQWALVQNEHGTYEIWTVVAWGFPHTAPEAGEAILSTGYGYVETVTEINDSGEEYVCAIGTRQHVEAELAKRQEARQ